MNKYKSIIIVLNLLILLIYFNYSVSTKETILKDGKLILLELAPTDPRSLMQGDYMTLRYKIAARDNIKQYPKRGYCVVQLDDRGIANVVRFQRSKTPLSTDERLIEYSSPDDWDINIGAESYFFEEGQADKFGVARYGALKVDTNGNSLLVGLYDEHLKRIE